jgi:hypothetical protein
MPLWLPLDGDRIAAEPFCCTCYTQFHSVDARLTDGDALQYLEPSILGTKGTGVGQTLNSIWSLQLDAPGERFYEVPVPIKDAQVQAKGHSGPDDGRPQESQQLDLVVGDHLEPVRISFDPLKLALSTHIHRQQKGTLGRGPKHLRTYTAKSTISDARCASVPFPKHPRVDHDTQKVHRATADN